MRKIVIGALVIVAMIVAAPVIFVATFDVNRYRSAIQSELEERLDRKVTMGEMGLSVFPPRFRVENFAINDDAHFNSRWSFVEARELDVSIKVWPLIKRSVQIGSLSLKEPRLELIKNPQGDWNFGSLGSRPEAAQPPQPVPAERPSRASSQVPQPSAKPVSSEVRFTLGELVITDGQIAITDLQAKSPRAVYDHIDIRLSDFAPGRPFSLQAAARLPGPGNQDVFLDGKGGPVVQNQPALTPFQGTLKFQQVGIIGLAKFLNSPAFANTDGIISGETQIASDSGKVTVNGQMNIQNPRVHGINLGYPITAQYDLTDDLVADLINVRNLILKLGSTPLAISGTVNTNRTPAQLDLNLRASNISVAEAAKLASASGVALAPGTNVSGRADASFQLRGAASQPALDGTLRASNLQLSGKEIAQPVEIPALNLILTPAEIRSGSFNLISGGTTMAVQLALRQYQSKSPTLNAMLRAPNAQLSGILSIAKAYGVTGADKITGAGVLNLDARATGPIRGLATEQMFRALSGTSTVDFRNVRYSGVDINH